MEKVQNVRTKSAFTSIFLFYFIRSSIFMFLEERNIKVALFSCG